MASRSSWADFGHLYGLNDYTVRGITVAFGVARLAGAAAAQRLGAIGALSPPG